MGAVDAKTLEDVKESYGRCCLNADFFEVFYTNFFTKYPIIVDKFKNTDLEKQQKLLYSGLNSLLLFLEGSEYARIQMKKIGEIHSRKNQDVSPTLYPMWKEALMVTIKQFDKHHMKPELEQCWDECLQIGLDFLAQYY